MINTIYKLVEPRRFIAIKEERKIQGQGVIVRPKKLSICAADQRYYTGNRPQEVLNKKLPMALIHEGAGEVVYDPYKRFNPGDKVVMIPNIQMEQDDIIGENYFYNNKFRSSGCDGFTQEYVFLHKDRVIKYNDIDDDVASFIELISVAIHAIRRFEEKAHSRRDVIGVWGDGNLAFIIALILKKIHIKSKIIVFGKHNSKLNFFSFVDNVYKIDEIPSELSIDHAFEAVGGSGCDLAINQIIDNINPEGTIMLLGVSESKNKINTRVMLERGLSLIGNSRSTVDDFKRAIEFLDGNKDCQNHLKKIISQTIDINNIADLQSAFEYDLSTSFKTVLNWDL